MLHGGSQAYHVPVSILEHLCGRQRSFSSRLQDLCAPFPADALQQISYDATFFLALLDFLLGFATGAIPYWSNHSVTDGSASSKSSSSFFFSSSIDLPNLRASTRCLCWASFKLSGDCAISRTIEDCCPILLCLLYACRLSFKVPVSECNEHVKLLSLPPLLFFCFFFTPVLLLGAIRAFVRACLCVPGRAS